MHFIVNYSRAGGSNSNTHLTVSQRRLATLPQSRISYTHAKGEDLAMHHPDGSADVIAVAEAMVLMDDDAALTSFARLLRSGGTLAVWFYGRPTFADPMLRTTAQTFIDAIMVRNWAEVIRGSGEQRLFGFRRAAEGMVSWLDYIDFDPSIWKDVRRIKWNPDATLAFFEDEACGFEVKRVSRVREVERREDRIDRGWWKNEWSVKDLERYFRVLFPGFKAAVGDGDKAIDELFLQLHEKMGGKNHVHKFTWPAVLVMATRK